MLVGLALVLLVFSILISAAAAQHVNGSPCGDPPQRISPSFPYPLVIVILCCGSALLGRLAGYLREPVTNKPRVGEAPPSQDRWRAGLAQFWVSIFLLVCVACLAFETFSLAVGIWPITYYVRCANDYLPLPTIGGACITAFLLGHWLWFPAREGEE
jgi:hypothetical protein